MLCNKGSSFSKCVINHSKKNKYFICLLCQFCKFCVQTLTNNFFFWATQTNFLSFVLIVFSWYKNVGNIFVHLLRGISHIIFGGSFFKTYNWINSQTKKCKGYKDEHDIYSGSPTPSSLMRYIQSQRQTFNAIFVDYWTPTVCENVYANIVLEIWEFSSGTPIFQQFLGLPIYLGA